MKIFLRLRHIMAVMAIAVAMLGFGLSGEALARGGHHGHHGHHGGHGHHRHGLSLHIGLGHHGHHRSHGHYAPRPYYYRYPYRYEGYRVHYGRPYPYRSGYYYRY